MGFNANVFKKYTGGPKGLGDPDDTYLSQPEKDVLVRRVIRERSLRERCSREMAEFAKCAEENQYFKVLKCKPLSNILKDCLTLAFNDEEFIKECTQMYLQERSEYRRTGRTKEERELKRKLVQEKLREMSNASV